MQTAPQTELEYLRRRVRELEEKIRAAQPIRSHADLQPDPATASLLNSMPVAVYICRAPDGRLEWYNERAAELWGRRPVAGIDDIRFCGSGRLYRPDGTWLPHDRTPAALALHHGRTFRDQEVIIERPDGSRITVLANIDPLRGAAGNVVGFVNVFQDISERRRAEQAVRDRDDFLRLITNALPHLVSYLDADGRYVFNNAAYERWFGIPVDAWLGRTVSDMLGDADYELLKPFMDRVLLGEAVTLERPIRTVGGLRWAQVTGTPDIETGGAVRGLIVGVTDVHDLKLAENAARESDLKYRTMFDSAVVGMAQATVPEGRFLAVNNRYAEMLGCSPKELLGRTYIEVTHPEDREANRELYAALIDGRLQEYTYEKRYVRRDEQTIWVRTSISLVRDADGAPAYTVGIIEDITERRRTSEALRESEARLRLASAAAKVVLWEWDIFQDRLVCSEGAEKLLGKGLPETGSTAVLFESVHPDDREALMTSLQAAVADGIALHQDYRVVRPDGQIRWLSATGTILRDASGRALRIAGATVDITDRKLAEHAVEIANEHLRRSNADLEQFAWAAAHDLKEPLRNIDLYAQLLKRKISASADAEADLALKYVASSSRRMQALVNALLAYTRVVAVHPEPASPVDAAAVATRVSEDLSVAIAECGASVQVDELPAVCVEETHFAQLLQNLVSNALKYRAPGVNPTVRISASPGGACHRFTVSDNGIGIAPEYHERIFGVFKRLHGQEIPGTGIGLALCRRIVEHYGGSIGVESRPGEGATFWFTLPA